MNSTDSFNLIDGIHALVTKPDESPLNENNSFFVMDTQEITFNYIYLQYVIETLYNIFLLK